jgi:hypothetical protein
MYAKDVYSQLDYTLRMFENSYLGNPYCDRIDFIIIMESGIEDGTNTSDSKTSQEES